MGTSDETPKKISSQKGQGMLEYALMMSFVAMIYLIVFAEGGIGGSILEVYNSAAEMVINAAEESDLEGGGSGGGSIVAGLFGGGGSSSGVSSSSGSTNSNLADMDSAEHALVPAPSKELDPLDWQTILTDIKLTYKTITLSSTPNRAIASEYNLFGQVASLTSGKKEYNYADDDLKGWNDLMVQMETQMAESNFTPNYKRGSERFTIARVDTDNAVKLTYSNGTNETSFYVYAENNEMKFTYASPNGRDSDNAFDKYLEIAPQIYSGGWSYDR